MAAVNTSLEPTRIPGHVQTILADEKCLKLGTKSSDFWIMCRALKEFIDGEGQGHLPVRGTIPDMFSDSARYVQLQNVYREKAAQDAEAVLKIVHDQLESIGRPAVRTDCRMVFFIQCLFTYIYRPAEPVFF